MKTVKGAIEVSRFTGTGQKRGDENGWNIRVLDNDNRVIADVVLTPQQFSDAMGHCHTKCDVRIY